ncbi:MAG: toluene tolerance protein [Pseudomonadales bacterium]
MEWLSESKYQSLVEDHQVLESAKGVIKVMLLPDDRVVKLFPQKLRFSSTLVHPRGFRFVRNARRIASSGFHTVQVEQIFFSPTTRGYGVIYRLIEGEAQQKLGSFDDSLVKALARLIANLHDSGIYFRALHLGNIILTNHGELALIDVADVRFSRRSLSQQRRCRNFQHLFRLARHRVTFEEFGVDRLFDEYLNACESPSLTNSATMRRRLIDIWDHCNRQQSTGAHTTS